MSQRKMIPPLPESFGGSEQERFQRFAKAVLSVPKTEITPAEKMLAKLYSDRELINSKIANVRRSLKERGSISRCSE